MAARDRPAQPPGDARRSTRRRRAAPRQRARERAARRSSWPLTPRASRPNRPRRPVSTRGAPWPPARKRRSAASERHPPAPAPKGSCRPRQPCHPQPCHRRPRRPLPSPRQLRRPWPPRPYSDPAPGSGACVRPISLVLRGDRQTLLTWRWAGRGDGRRSRSAAAPAARAARSSSRHARSKSIYLASRKVILSGASSPTGGARQVAQGLASMGYRFDGRRAGWTASPHHPRAGHGPVACGPRPARLAPAGQSGCDRRAVAGHRRAQSRSTCPPGAGPDLEQVIACLGPRAAGLAELWDMWGRLRTLLLTPA